MKRHRRESFIDDIRSKQRNIVFPDTVRNGRSVDVFLWNGSPDPPLVQRIVAWMFGLFFLALAELSLFVMVLGAHRGVAFGDRVVWILATLPVGSVCAYAGARVFRNGFPRRESSK